MIGPKVLAWRSRPYRMFVASHDCFACAIGSYSQCAHGNFGKGARLKVGDDRSFPLCGPRLGMPGCHFQHDTLLDMTLDQRREAELIYIERMQGIARAAGWKLPGDLLIPKLLEVV